MDDVLQRLADNDVHLVTVSNVVGRGRQKGVAEVIAATRSPGSCCER